MYTWEYNEGAEIWINDTYDTIDQCIKAAKEDDSDRKVVFIGEVVPYVPRVNAEGMLDNLEQDAYEQCGEVGQDWDAYDYRKQEELEELNDALSNVLHDWLKKYDRYPSFYNIRNVKEYSLVD